MGDDTADLILQLCTQAGMIMEDTSPIALTVRVDHEAELNLALASLRKAALQIVLIIAAAEALTD